MVRIAFLLVVVMSLYGCGNFKCQCRRFFSCASAHRQRMPLFGYEPMASAIHAEHNKAEAMKYGPEKIRHTQQRAPTITPPIMTAITTSFPMLTCHKQDLLRASQRAVKHC